MGRLDFLRRTAGPVLEAPGVGYCLVDYSCPERAGAWLERNHAQAVQSGRLLVERVPERERFNKCEALNVGARRVSGEGARVLCFLDADTLVAPPFFAWLEAHVRDGEFSIADLRPDGSDRPSLTGVLALTARDFATTTGFDQAFDGWGGEDIEFRLRLHVLHGLSFARIPLALLEPLEHDDGLRTRFYPEKDLQASDRTNHVRLVHKLRGWQRGHAPVSASARALFFQGPVRTAPASSGEAY
jgi:hypothetical protein